MAIWPFFWDSHTIIAYLRVHPSWIVGKWIVIILVHPVVCVCIYIYVYIYIRIYIYLELPNTGFFNSKPKKDPFWGLVWKKEHRSGFGRSGHFGRSGVEKSVQKALKKRSKPVGSVLEFKKAFWSGNNRSGVLFLLNLGKLIDFGFCVSISTIKRIQVYIYISMYIHLKYPHFNIYIEGICICIISPFLHELFTTAGAASRPGWALPTAMALLAARHF